MAAKKKTKKKTGKKKVTKKTGTSARSGRPTGEKRMQKMKQEVVDRYRVTIEDNIPVPRLRRTIQGRWDATFDALEVGQSFFVPDGYEGEENIIGRMQSQTTKYNKKYEDRHFMGRKVVEQHNGVPVEGVRIWRDQ